MTELMLILKHTGYDADGRPVYVSGDTQFVDKAHNMPFPNIREVQSDKTVGMLYPTDDVQFKFVPCRVSV